MLDKVVTIQQLTDDHHLFTSARDVQEICRPFFTRYALNAFFYGRIENDGTTYGLISNAALLKLFFEKELSIYPHAPTDIDAHSFYFLGNNTEFFENKEIFHQAKTIFDIDYPIHFIERHIGYAESYGFAASSSRTNTVNFYLNNIELFESFKFLFKEQARELLLKAKMQKIFIPKHMRPNFKGYVYNDESTNTIQLFKEQVKNINYLLQLHFNTQLTARELQTFSYLLRGYTAVETARLLRLSPKTVESYIGLIKAKFNCLNRAALFDKIFERNLINIIIKI